jgi:hypothetical protein
MKTGKWVGVFLASVLGYHLLDWIVLQMRQEEFLAGRSTSGDVGKMDLEKHGISSVLRKNIKFRIFHRYLRA